MKILSLFTALLLILSLAGCSFGANTPAEMPLVTENAAENPVAEEPSDEPLIDDGLTPVYDNSAVVEAYKSGDSSALDEKQLTILNGAVEAISEFYREGMNEEQIVIAAHDWIVTTTVYDENMLLVIPKQTPDTENPYAVFTIHQAICMGYTTTFQLFMDMLGVESIVVHGSALDEEHAWNMVCLGGEWYHVDCTWDDFVPDEDGRPAFHTYTLVPDYVMEVEHVWDRDNSPKATAEDKIYFKTHGAYAQSAEECSYLLITAFNNQQRYSEIMMNDTSRLAFDCTTQYWVHDLNKYIVVTFWLQ